MPDTSRGPHTARFLVIELLREDAAIAVCSLFAGRQDSAVHLRSGDIGVDDEFVWLRLLIPTLGTNVRRVVRIPLVQQAVAGHCHAPTRACERAR